MTDQDKCFLVYGIHRSGTSATAGILHHLGVHMGDQLLGADPYNARGHFENTRFLDLNENILRSAGGAWDRPPTEEQLSTLDYPRDRLETFLESARRPLWGLKDPRFVITYTVWKSLFQRCENITHVFVKRSQRASVLSLMNRNHFEEKYAVHLVESYRSFMDRCHVDLEQRNADVIEVQYEQLIQNPDEFVGEVNCRLNRSTDDNLSVVRDFLDARLRHF